MCRVQRLDLLSWLFVNRLFNLLHPLLKIQPPNQRLPPIRRTQSTLEGRGEATALYAAGTPQALPARLLLWGSPVHPCDSLGGLLQWEILRIPLAAHPVVKVSRQCLSKNSQCFSKNSQCFSENSQCFSENSQCFSKSTHIISRNSRFLSFASPVLRGGPANISVSLSLLAPLSAQWPSWGGLHAADRTEGNSHLADINN